MRETQSEREPWRGVREEGKGERSEREQYCREKKMNLKKKL